MLTYADVCLTYADVCCVGEQLMKFAVERKRRLEEDRRGLVILQVYLATSV
jgi:hypothetical protein